MVRAVPKVIWSPPSPIVYGTTLSAIQLDATASVPGSFSYSPASGTMLDAGAAQSLSVTFTPQDTTDYTTVTTTATISVTKATPALEVTDAGGRFDGSAFPASATVAGAVSGVDNRPAASLGGVTPTLAYYGTRAPAWARRRPPPPGTYTVVADFPGDADYAAVRSSPIAFTITPASATIALASSGGWTVYGQPVTFVATVAAVAAGATPGGTVSFSDGGTLLGTVPLDGSGRATLTTSALAVGSHAITASYSGDADFVGAQSGSASESVSQARTEVVLVPQPVLNKKKKVVSIGLEARIDDDRPGRRRADRRDHLRTGEELQEEDQGDDARDRGRRRR